MSYGIEYTASDGLTMRDKRNRFYRYMNLPVVDRMKTILMNKAMKVSMDFCEKNIKNHFGKEFMFYSYQSGNIVELLNLKFFKKYDKKYKEHASLRTNDTMEYRNVKLLIKLDEATYMFIAAGNSGDIESKFFMQKTLSENDLYLYIFGRKMRRYVKEVEDIISSLVSSSEIGLFEVDKSSSYNNYREDGHESLSLDVIYSKLPLRDLDTLYFSNYEKEKICSHIDRFNSQKDFYQQRQLLYKTGILLYGEPGTGKTSLVKAIATKYDRSIVNINISNLLNIDLVKLTQSINIDDTRQYIILLEDIDTLFLNREKDNTINKEDQAIINKLLQFLDSNSSPSNVIFIATTNHIDRLDSALLRDGRFDCKVEVKPLTREGAYQFGDSFELSRDIMTDILNELDESMSERAGKYNQSTLQNRILAKISNKSNDKIIEIYGEMVDSSTDLDK